MRSDDSWGVRMGGLLVLSDPQSTIRGCDGSFRSVLAVWPLEISKILVSRQFSPLSIISHLC